MFIRFVITEIDEDSERRLGIFHAASALRDAGLLEPYEEEALAEIREWFNTHLERPDRFSRTKIAYRSTKKRGISWFKASAHEHIEKVRVMGAMLERHGVPVTMLKVDRVGYVLYEDDHQIVAEPFADVTC